MDLFYFPLLLLLLLLTFILLLLLHYPKISSRPKTTEANLPPGPRQLPIIGSIHHMLGSLPHHRLRDLSQIHGPIMYLKLGDVSNIVISSAEAAREIMKTHDITFSSRPLATAIRIITYGGKGLVFAPYGEFWRQMRKVSVLELLSAKRIHSFRYIREEEVDNLVCSIASSGSPVMVNLSQRLYSLTNDITVRTVIGDKCKDQATFLSALKETVQAAGGFDLVDLFPSSLIVSLLCRKRFKLEKTHRKADVILENIIQERRARRMGAIGGDNKAEEKDMLDVLLRVQEEGNLGFPLIDTNLKAVIQDMFGAGSESSSTTLVWAITELVKNPRAMKKLQSEIRGVLEQNGKLTEEEVVQLGYLKLVVKETLRLHPPHPLLLPRECQETCEVLGYEIPEKARVVVNAWAIGRDQRYWGEDAEEFRPERFDGSLVDFKGNNFEFLPFGAGRRICPGMTFGLANVDLALAQLMGYFDWEVPPDVHGLDAQDMEETNGMTARKRHDLCLRAIPRVLPRATEIE